MLNIYGYKEGGLFESSAKKNGLKYIKSHAVSRKRKECDAFFEESYNTESLLVSPTKINKTKETKRKSGGANTYEGGKPGFDRPPRELIPGYGILP